MDSLILVLAAIIVLTGLIGMILPLLPGTPLVFGGLLLAAWIEDFSRVSGATMMLLAGLALVAWLIDIIAATLSVRRANASSHAISGAGLGTLAGVFGGLPGLVIGPVIGAITGEWIARRNAIQAGRAGIAAGLGFLLALALKLAIGFAMTGLFLTAYFL